MSDESENPIHIEASRARLRRLAKKRWGDDKTDDELATELVELVHSEFPANTLNSLTTGTVLKPSSKHSLYAVIDLKETVIGGFDNPQLMTKEDAENLAKDRYPNHSDDFIDSLIIKWNATQITFRSSGSVFDLDKNNPIVTHDDGEVRPIKSESDMKEAIEKCQSSMSKNSKAGLKERIFRLLSSDEDNLAIKRGLHKNLDDIIADRDQIRKHQITLRRDWLNDPKNAPSSFNEEGKLVTELKGKKNCEEAGGTNPGMVNLEKPKDYLLLSALIGLFSDYAPIAVVLCKSQMWMHQTYEEWELRRKSLLNHRVIGITEGSNLQKVVENMITNQFSVQPIFSKEGVNLGSLELKTLTSFIALNGLKSLPQNIDASQLRDQGLLGNVLPTIDARFTVDTVSQYLSAGMSTDAIIFEWNSDLHSAILPPDCQGILEDGVHIVTSHDLVAYKMWEEATNS